MPIPSISFRLAIVAMLAVLGAWYGYFDQRQHNILLMHFAGSSIGVVLFAPLPFAALAAFLGWSKSYFRKTYLIVAGCIVALKTVNHVTGFRTEPGIDLEATIMSVIIAITAWFAFELFQYVKQYRDTK